MRSETIIPDNDLPQLKVQRLFFKDWDNYVDAAISEVDRIRDSNLPGCWYINATSCVSSPDPVDEFFDEIAKRRGAWCRTLDRHFGKGWRTIRKQTKDRYQRGVEFEGVLIINGKRALPEDIPAMRRLLGQLPTVIRRNQAFRLLKQRQLNELRNLTAEEFRLRQNSDRSEEGYAYFILPHATVESPVVTPAFIEEANLRKREWHRTVDRLFPMPERRRFFDDVGDLCELIPRGLLLVAERPTSITR